MSSKHKKLFTFKFDMKVACILIFSAAILLGSALAQQNYPGDYEGYTCSNYSETCQTYILYKAQSSDTLQSVAALFRISTQQIMDSSNLSNTVTNLEAGRAVIIPALCTCNTGRYQYNVSYIIQKGDTFYLVSNNTFEGLTHYLAVVRANPLAVPTNLQPGDNIIFPIRCACPTSGQLKKGTNYLMTDSIFPNETVASIAADWNVAEKTIRSANVATSGSSLDDLEQFTTILIPFRSTPVVLKSSTPPPSVTPAPYTQPPPPITPVTGSNTRSNSHTGLYVGVGVGCSVVVAAIIIGFLTFFMCRRKNLNARKTVPSKPENKKPSHSAIVITQQSLDDQILKTQELHQDHFTRMPDLLDSEKPAVFSYEALKAATQNFSPSCLIQGSVYRGIIGDRWVAIKEMKGSMTQELKILCKAHHANLIKLVGICDNPEHLYLVYEYAENGSLYDCLHGTTDEQGSSSTVFLSWNTRLQIALDVATGLEYIHNFASPSFVHKDIKSSNILLDGRFHAKISNFGTAKFSGSSQAGAPMLTSHLLGTHGYMPPEYLEHGMVSPKLDIYALGVVFLELLSGLEAIIRDPYGAKCLAAEIGPILDCDNSMDSVQNWIDSRLGIAFSLDCAYGFAVLAKSCVEDDPSRRPNMKEITYKLSKFIKESLEWEARMGYAKHELEGR